MASIPVFYNKKASSKTLSEILPELNEIIAEIKAIEIK